MDQLIVDKRRVGLRPRGEVHALRRFGVDRTHQVLVHRLGYERREGCQELGQRYETRVQRRVGRQLVSVRA